MFRRNALLSRKRMVLIGAGALTLGTVLSVWAQERPTFRIKVDMVVLSFTVTDSKGHYINGLKPTDFRITEDGIPQKLNTFGEGNKPPVQVLEGGKTQPLGTTIASSNEVEGNPASEVRSDSFVGTNVFVLF